MTLTALTPDEIQHRIVNLKRTAVAAGLEAYRCAFLARVAGYERAIANLDWGIVVRAPRGAAV
jgi:hypothetical protein